MAPGLGGCYHYSHSQDTTDVPLDRIRRPDSPRARGDSEAAAGELVAQYESVIRRVIRFRLTDSRLRAAFDSMDVCQSVLDRSSFGPRTASTN